MKSVIYCMAFFFLLCNLSFSAERPEFRFHGFSEKGDICVFELYGYHDGSGFPFSEIHIIDADTNEYKTKIYSETATNENFEINPDVDFYRKKNLSKCIDIFNQHKISEKNSVLAFQYPDYDYIRTDIDYSNKSININGQEYSLTVIEKDTGIENPFDFDGNIKMMKLTLKKNNKEFVLQEDTTLPVKRKYAKSYRLSAAYFFNNRLAVIVEYDKPGYEGNDNIKMIATCNLTKF